MEKAMLGENRAIRQEEIILSSIGIFIQDSMLYQNVDLIHTQ